MEKKFYFAPDNTTYTVRPCTAIAVHEDGYDELNRQEAVLVENTEDSGELVQYVVFGWKIDQLNTVEDFADMCEDFAMWDSDYEILDTVEVICKDRASAKQVIAAEKKVLTMVGIDPTIENIVRLSGEYLTINISPKDGRQYCWYMDNEYEACISVDTLEEADPEELRLY
jgi:hypothetical protein